MWSPLRRCGLDSCMKWPPDFIYWENKREPILSWPQFLANLDSFKVGANTWSIVHEFLKLLWIMNIHPKGQGLFCLGGCFQSSNPTEMTEWFILIFLFSWTVSTVVPYFKLNLHMWFVKLLTMFFSADIFRRLEHQTISMSNMIIMSF